MPYLCVQTLYTCIKTAQQQQRQQPSLPFSCCRGMRPVHSVEREATCDCSFLSVFLIHLFPLCDLPARYNARLFLSFFNSFPFCCLSRGEKWHKKVVLGTLAGITGTRRESQERRMRGKGQRTIKIKALQGSEKERRRRHRLLECRENLIENVTGRWLATSAGPCWRSWARGMREREARARRRRLARWILHYLCAGSAHRKWLCAFSSSSFESTRLRSLCVSIPPLPLCCCCCVHLKWKERGPYLFLWRLEQHSWWMWEMAHLSSLFLNFFLLFFQHLSLYETQHCRLEKKKTVFIMPIYALCVCPYRNTYLPAEGFFSKDATTDHRLICSMNTGTYNHIIYKALHKKRKTCSKPERMALRWNVYETPKKSVFSVAHIPYCQKKGGGICFFLPLQWFFFWKYLVFRHHPECRRLTRIAE